MKITNKHLTLILILLIGLNSITSTSLSIKSYRNKSLSKRNKTYLTSKEASDMLLKKLKEQITDPLNISYFIMGIVSTWIPKVEDLYKEVKKIKNFFDPCKDFITEIWDMVKGKSKTTDPDKQKEQAKIQEKKQKHKEQIEKLEKPEKNKEEDEQKFCKKTEEILDKMYRISVDDLFQHKSKNEKSSVLRSAADQKPEYLCEFTIASKVAVKKIIEEFETVEHFTDVCLSFRKENDCTKFKPDNTGAWNFIKKTLKYGILVKNGASCLVNIMKKGGKDESKGTAENPQITALANDAFSAWSSIKVALQEAGAFVAHILSFGIWGVLRAAWNLIKLAKNIFELVSDFAEDFPFRIGKLVGLVLKICKALVVGRRRRK